MWYGVECEKKKKKKKHFGSCQNSNEKFGPMLYFCLIEVLYRPEGQYHVSAILCTYYLSTEPLQ